MGCNEGNCSDFRLKRDLWLLIITLTLFVIGIVYRKDMNAYSIWSSLSLFIIAYFLVGWDVVLKALKGTLKGNPFEENFLMTIATVGALCIGEYPEAVAVMLFFKVGAFLQDLAVNNSRRSIRSLLELRPDVANLYVNKDIKKVNPETVAVGDLIAIRPGERVPLDGVVIEGSSQLDTSALTGESRPRTVNIEDFILSGMVNKQGLLIVKVTKLFHDSSITKILNLVENASSKKAETEKFITKLAKIYTPIVVCSALLLAIIPPIVTSGSFSDWVARSLVLLVISCPCGLVISIPLAYFGGVGGAAKRGVLIKGAKYLDTLVKLKIVVFDKTGTLTKGNFSVTKKIVENGFTEKELLEIAAFAEAHSSHPIATSIKEAYGKEISIEKVEEYQEVAGMGVKASIDGKEVLVGSSRLLDENEIFYLKPSESGTIIHVVVNQKHAGYLVIADEIKEDSKTAILGLKKLGIKKTVMLTGDQKEIANSVGKELEIEQIESQLLPQDKLSHLEMLMEQLDKKEKIAFVGDGVNDAPVIARADIGVAMGGLGSDAAIETADIVIMSDKPSKLIEAIKQAVSTKKILWQNIVFALTVKGIFVLLGAFGEVNMWQAIFADVGVALLAIFNSTRLLSIK
jgi:Zn2+/Cd2+-exporting ATPase